MKKMLFIKASKDISDLSVIDINCHAMCHSISVKTIEIKSQDELENELRKLKEKFDYIYLAAHGNDKQFGDTDNSFILKWEYLGQILCSADCINEDCIFLLYCCRGGLNQVAYRLFSSCQQIQYICGARQKMTNIDLTIGFNVFLYNIECRHIDPILAAEKATIATENRFKCFDRLEVESEPIYYYNFCPDCKDDDEEHESDT